MNIWNDPNASLDERVDALLDAMTLEEKVGQLGSYWPNRSTSVEIAGDVAPMESAMGAGLSWDDSIKHGLGHLTRVSRHRARGRQAKASRLCGACSARSSTGRVSASPRSLTRSASRASPPYGATVYPGPHGLGRHLRP